MTTNRGDERFQSGAKKYAAYLNSTEGRLRLDLAFANLQEFLPQATKPLRALDVGCGTGALAVRLAQLGVHVTLLDSSPQMLEFAERSAHDAGVGERISLQQGDAGELDRWCEAETFDVILCHNVLEYLEHPGAVLRNAARALRDRSSVISVLVRNRAGDVLRAAIKDGDLPSAELNLTREWGRESLYGGDVRLFTPQSIRAALEAASLTGIAERGIRVLADYLPKTVRDREEAAVFELERKLGKLPEFGAVARYTHCLARRAQAD